MINKDISFRELFQKYPESIQILIEKGMHCIGCPASMQETLEEGLIAHGLNPDEVVREMNKKLFGETKEKKLKNKNFKEK